MSKAYLEPKEIEKLENAAKYIRDKLLIRILFHSGARISEVISLETKNVDFDQGTLTIQHLKSRINLVCPDCGARLGRSHSFCPNCGQKVSRAIAKEQQQHRMRTIPLDPETLSMLKDFIQRGGPVQRRDRYLLFPFNRHRGWQILRDAAQRAGLPKLVNPETGKIHGVSPHKLRDAFAVHAVKLDDSGDGLRLLQEHLGHASFNTTARYRKVSGTEHRDWYQKLWHSQDKNNGNGT